MLLLVVHTWPEAELEGGEPVGRIISARKRQYAKGGRMKKGISRQITRQQAAELEKLAGLPDVAIDTSDAPELPDWSGAKRGLFYRPVKQQLTLRLDADVVAWFRDHTTPDEGYQTRINRVLREYIEARSQRNARPAASSGLQNR